MTLNANFAGAQVLVGRQRLQGPDRGLDALVGLVILVSTALIGFLAISALYVSGSAAVARGSADSGTISVGFAVAVYGSAIVVGITLLVFLVRLVAGRRSWRGTLVGAILMTVVLFVGYTIMASA